MPKKKKKKKLKMEIAQHHIVMGMLMIRQAAKMKCAGGKSKRPWTFKLFIFIITPTRRFSGIWFCLNIPIDMQVSAMSGW